MSPRRALVAAVRRAREARPEDKADLAFSAALVVFAGWVHVLDPPAAIVPVLLALAGAVVPDRWGPPWPGRVTMRAVRRARRWWRGVSDEADGPVDEEPEQSPSPRH